MEIEGISQWLTHHIEESDEDDDVENLTKADY